ncbi:hypothetical protein HELRODRAFT_130473, partial [Helobdella robusta]|uniref:Synapsin ATP-binding domain-containing protein n=1 Tax=Helobdella robusta TaxID=6412 RepID=T1EHT9_HELRO
DKDNYKCVLVIDDRHTDWFVYFRKLKVFGRMDIRVEQAEFRELNLTSFAGEGMVVHYRTIHSSFISRLFQPDIILVRQHARNATENWSQLLIGLMHGGVPSVNQLHSLYNFMDKPWVFSNLVRLRNKLGRDKFPLIEQTFYPNHKEMMSNLWVIVARQINQPTSKHSSVKVDDHHLFQDIASIMGVTECYATVEPHIQSLGDVHIIKIGHNYKAYIRRAMSGNWKANVGSAILEQVPVNDRYKSWVDECSKIFGGLDIICVKAILAADGREFIVEVTDSSLPLLGNEQEEDCQLMADLVIRKL